MTLAISIIASIIVLLFLLNEYYYWVASDYTQDYHMRKGENGGPYDAISFGSAYCRYGLDFKGADVNGYNYGYASQFFYYTNLMLHQYAKTCKKGSVVYLIIADLVFARVGKGMYGAEEYIKFLNKDVLGDEFSYIRFLKNRFPLFKDPRLIVRCLFRLVGVSKTDLFKTLQVSQLSESQVLLEADKRCQSWCRQFGLADTISGDVSEELEANFIKSRQILTEMIQFCLDNGLTPILVVTPVSREMNKRLGDPFLDAVLFNNIHKANTQGVPLLNYLRDDRFVDYKLYHNNADFLNARGRTLFTRILISDTNKILKNENRDINIS